MIDLLLLALIAASALLGLMVAHDERKKQASNALKKV